jgi:Protein of unknown function (DUF2442)
MTAMDKLVDITKVEVIGDHELRLTFEDGVVGDIAFDDSEWEGVFEPLRDPKRFAKVAIELGTIVWPDDGLDMAPEPLYEEALEHQVSQAARMTA